MSLFTKQTTKITERLDSKNALFDHALVSVAERSKNSVYLVVGSYYHNKASCVFNKRALTALIEELTLVRDALD